MMGLELSDISWYWVYISIRVDFEYGLWLIIPSIEHSVDLEFEFVYLVLDDMVWILSLILLLSCMDLCLIFVSIDEVVFNAFVVLLLKWVFDCFTLGSFVCLYFSLVIFHLSFGLLFKHIGIYLIKMRFIDSSFIFGK